MISPNIKWILDNLSGHKEDEIFSEDRGPAISVNKLTGKAGLFYEKLRYLVDYKEEHTIRRSAIERIVKRKLLVEGGDNIGLSLLQELVGGGYLANKRIPEEVADDVQSIINKYLVLGSGKIRQSKLASIMASEIERLLYPQFINDLIVESFYTTTINQIKYTGNLSDEELKIQTYIGCRRSLLEDDNDTVLYAVLTKYIPELPTANEDGVHQLSSHFVETFHAAEAELENSLGWKIASKLKNRAIYFSVIKEIIRKYGVVAETIFSDPNRLEEEIKRFMSEKYGQQQEILNKSGNRAVAYILMTKIILALALELPYEKLFLSHIDYLALGTNIVFHPLLLLAMVKTAPLPSANDTSMIISGVRGIVQNETKPVYIKPPIDNIFLLSIFGLFYAALFGVSFGLILWVLNSLHFNIVSVVLFLFFLTLVSYFGSRIRHNARKWKVSTEDERFFSLLWNFITIPIIRTGRWLSRRFSSINVFVFLMDFILETPFKFILGTFDAFVSFLKEKREDPY